MKPSEKTVRKSSMLFAGPVLAASLLFGALDAGAQEVRPAPIKALLILGGCCHDYAAQKDLLKAGIESRANVSVDVVYSPPAIDPEQPAIQQTLTGIEILDVPFAAAHDLRNALPMFQGVVQDERGDIHIQGGAADQTYWSLDGFNITDPIIILTHLFLGGPQPLAPYPECGPGALAEDEELGCETPPAGCS